MKRLMKAGARAILDICWRIRVKTSLVSCSLCGSRRLSAKEAYARLFIVCRECGGIQAREIPQFIQLIGMGTEGSWGGALQGGEREHFLAHLLKSLIGAETFLLYGSGATRAPIVLKHEDFAVKALDVSNSAVQFLNEASGATIAFTHKTAPQGMNFDVVIACEVFEHFNDPKRWFGFINGFLRGDGIICGSTDFCPGGDIYEGDGRPGYMSLLGHTFYWSQQSMEWLASRFGMKFISFEMQCPGSIYPDSRFGILFPNKRIFFFTRSEDAYRKLTELRSRLPVLPLDTRDYWDRMGFGDVGNIVSGKLTRKPASVEVKS